MAFRFIKRVLKHQRLKYPALLVTAAACFAATFVGQKMKPRILCEKLLVISRRFFGIAPFRFYAPAEPTTSRQLELPLAWEA